MNDLLIINLLNNINIISLDYYENKYPFYYYNVIILLHLTFYDTLLKIIFGNKGRWFQLHAYINLIVAKNIFSDVLNIYIDPTKGFKLLDNHYNSYYILGLHIYHLLTFNNLTFIDYFHHILFVGLGVLPVIFYINYNQIFLGYIACNGIPGIIEYGTLALYKNNKISIYTQKCVSSLLYIYLRLPLCITGVCYNFIGYNNGYIKDNLYLSLYINVLLYFNGTFFTHLTLQSFYKIKYFNNKITKIN